jgi:hypothetical protein
MTRDGKTNSLPGNNIVVRLKKFSKIKFLKKCPKFNSKIPKAFGLCDYRYCYAHFSLAINFHLPLEEKQTLRSSSTFAFIYLFAYDNYCLIYNIVSFRWIMLKGFSQILPGRLRKKIYKHSQITIDQTSYTLDLSKITALCENLTICIQLLLPFTVCVMTNSLFINTGTRRKIYCWSCKILLQ